MRADGPPRADPSDGGGEQERETVRRLRSSANHIRNEEPLTAEHLSAFLELHQSLPEEDTWSAPRGFRRYVPPTLAAALLLGGVASWLYWTGIPKDGEHVGLVTGFRLSTSPRIERGGEDRRSFRAGEEVYVHFLLRESAGVFLALLEVDGKFVPSPGEDVRKLDPGWITLGPFRLGDGAGEESVVLLASRGDLTAERARRLVAEVDGALSRPRKLHAELLEKAVVALRAERGLTVEAVTFHHLPRS